MIRRIRYVLRIESSLGLIAGNRLKLDVLYQYSGVKMKKINKTPLAVAMGAAFLSTFAATSVNAEANPFGMTEMSAGYMQVAAADKAAEMACGAAMGGMTKPKTAEGACAGNKKTDGAKPTEGSCGAFHVEQLSDMGFICRVGNGHDATAGIQGAVRAWHESGPVRPLGGGNDDRWLHVYITQRLPG